MGRTLLDRLARYLWPLALANLVANIGIVLTGGAVRLTGSGLSGHSDAHGIPLGLQGLRRTYPVRAGGTRCRHGANGQPSEGRNPLRSAAPAS